MAGNNPKSDMTVDDWEQSPIRFQGVCVSE